MAKTFLTNINLKGNQLLNAALQPSASAPSAYTAGQLYYNTVDNLFYFSTGAGTGNWSAVGVQYIESSVAPFSVTDGELSLNYSTGLTVLDGNLIIDSTVVTKEGTQTLTNKTIGDNLHFNDGITNAGYIGIGMGSLAINANNALDISSDGQATITTTTGDIVLNADGNLYKGSVDPDNIIATFGDIVTDLEGYVTETGTQTLTNKTIEDVVLKDHVSFTNNADEETMYIEHSYTGTNRIVSVDDISIRSTDGDIILYPGNDNGGTGKAYVHWGNDATAAFPENEITTAGNTQELTNKTIDNSKVTGTTSFESSGTQYLAIYRSGTGTARITAADDLALRATNDIILYPGNDVFGHTGKAYIHWGDDSANAYPTREIATVGTEQTFTNKTIKDELYFDNPSTIPHDGGIKINDSNENFEIRAYTNHLDLIGHTGLDISTDGGDIILSPYNKAYVGSAIDQNEIATIGDLTAVESGLTWKASVNLLWDDPAADGTGLSGTLVIDDHAALTSANNGYRILLTKNGSFKGIYTYSDDDTNYTLTRSTDADTDEELKGAAVFVEEGTVYGATSWVQQNHYITSFANQNWVQFSGQGTYIGSNSILIDGNEISVILDPNLGLTTTGSGIKLDLNTNAGLDIDSGLYVNTGAGLKVDSNQVQVDYTSLESQLVTDDFAKNADYSTVTRKYSTDIVGDSLVDSFTITHGLGTRDVQVRVYQTSVGPDTRYSDVEVDIKRSAANTNDVIIDFASAPATGTTYGVVVIG